MLGAVWGLVTMFVYRDYRWRDLLHLVHRVVKTVAMVTMLIGFSVPGL